MAARGAVRRRSQGGTAVAEALRSVPAAARDGACRAAGSTRPTDGSTQRDPGRLPGVRKKRKAGAMATHGGMRRRSQGGTAVVGALRSAAARSGHGRAAGRARLTDDSAHRGPRCLPGAMAVPADPAAARKPMGATEWHLCRRSAARGVLPVPQSRPAGMARGAGRCRVQGTLRPLIATPPPRRRPRTAARSGAGSRSARSAPRPRPPVAGGARRCAAPAAAPIPGS